MKACQVVLGLNEALHPRKQGRILRKNSIFPTFGPFFDNISEVYQLILLVWVALCSGHSNEQIPLF